MHRWQVDAHLFSSKFPIVLFDFGCSARGRTEPRLGVRDQRKGAYSFFLAQSCAFARPSESFVVIFFLPIICSSVHTATVQLVTG